MRSTYRIPFKREVIVPDHWPIPMMGGSCKIIEENGLATAIEIAFTGEPVTRAPLVTKLDSGPIKFDITERDDRLNAVLGRIESALAFLECYYDVNLALDEVQVEYEGETSEEENQIDIKTFSMGSKEHALLLTFDMLTRALMAAESSDAPRFEATLARAAREALQHKRYIDSFRYSFLLIEAMFGEGKFKTEGLKTALKSNSVFVALVEKALGDIIPAKEHHTSDTKTLLEGSPSADVIIDHLVEKRGFYFHGNRRRKGAWRPEDQAEAEALALVAIGIAHQISQQAALPLFEAELEKRHFDQAMNAGAKIVYEVRYKYREPEENFSREGILNVNTPGTKVTGKYANDIARQFLAQFEYDTPLAAVETAQCVVQDTGQRVFDLVFHTTKP